MPIFPISASLPRRLRLLPLRYSGSAQVAQLVEQGTENPRVGGSIPSLGTIPLSPRLIRSKPIVELRSIDGWYRIAARPCPTIVFRVSKGAWIRNASNAQTHSSYAHSKA